MSLTKQIAPALVLALLACCGAACSGEAEPPSAAASPSATESTEPSKEASMANAHSFVLPSIDGGDLDFASFDGKAVLVVNTASMCGFTPQYEGLQALYDANKDKGLVVVGIPSQDFGGQEYDSAAETKTFCEMNFGINFPMTTKQVVKGDDAHPFYQWASAQLGDDAVPKWNFHKILIAPDGHAVKAYGSKVTPDDAGLAADIQALL